MRPQYDIELYYYISRVSEEWPFLCTQLSYIKMILFHPPDMSVHCGKIRIIYQTVD